MKNALQLLWNIIIYIVHTIVLFFGVLWFGKLPKVSMWHITVMDDSNDFKFKEIFNDKYIQSEHYPVISEKQFVDILYKASRSIPELLKNVPLKDANGKEFGQETLYSKLRGMIRWELNKLKEDERRTEI